MNQGEWSLGTENTITIAAAIAGLPIGVVAAGKLEPVLRPGFVQHRAELATELTQAQQAQDAAWKAKSSLPLGTHDENTNRVDTHFSETVQHTMAVQSESNKEQIWHGVDLVAGAAIGAVALWAVSNRIAKGFRRRTTK